MNRLESALACNTTLQELGIGIAFPNHVLAAICRGMAQNSILQKLHWAVLDKADIDTLLIPTLLLHLDAMPLRHVNIHYFGSEAIFALSVPRTLYQNTSLLSFTGAAVPEEREQAKLQIILERNNILHQLSQITSKMVEEASVVGRCFDKVASHTTCEETKLTPLYYLLRNLYVPLVTKTSNIAQVSGRRRCRGNE